MFFEFPNDAAALWPNTEPFSLVIQSINDHEVCDTFLQGKKMSCMRTSYTKWSHFKENSSKMRAGHLLFLVMDMPTGQSSPTTCMLLSSASPATRHLESRHLLYDFPIICLVLSNERDSENDLLIIILTYLTYLFTTVSLSISSQYVTDIKNL